jgi:hypothetical protein
MYVNRIHSKNITNILRGAGCPWLTPIILAIQEAEVRRIKV